MSVTVAASDALDGGSAPARVAPAGGLAVSPAAAWWTVAVIAVFQIVSMIDRVVVAVLIPEMRADFGLNDFQISLVQGLAFALFYGGMGLVIGGLVDRYSRRLIMFSGIVVWSCAAAACGLARSYAQLFAARVMVGFGEGAISPSAQSLLSAIFPRHRLSTPMAIFSASGVAGISISYLLGGVLLDSLTRAPLGGPLAGLAPWRQVLIVTGLPGVMVALLAFTLADPRRPMSRAAAVAESSWRGFFAFLRRHGRLMGGLMGGFALSSMATQGMMTWAPTYARRVLDVSATEVGSYMGLAVGVGGIVGTVLLGLFIDWRFTRGRRDIALRMFAAYAAIVPPLCGLAFLFGDFATMIAAIMLQMFTVGASIGPGLAAVQMIAPVMLRGRCGALAVLVSNVGGMALGPMIIGALTDYVFRDPGQVGSAIATALLILGPASGAVIWWARSPFVERLAEIEKAG